MTESSQEAGQDSKKQPPATPPLEWAFAILGAIIVVAVIAFNITEALKDQGSPPDIQVEMQKQLRMSSGFLLQIKAFNKGDSSAAGVMLEGSLNESGKQVEMSQITFDYVAAHSSKAGGLYFARDPAKYELKLRVLGYQDP